MSIKGKSMVISTLKCSRCGAVMFVPRPKGGRRPHGHIKTMWCWKCKEKTDFVEE